MTKIILRCKLHGHPVTFNVHEQTAYLHYLCAECEANVLIDVEPDSPMKPTARADECTPC